MSVLTLVRHGQASFFADDYDKLSPLGEQQARLVGEYWARQRLPVDEVYMGPRARQRRSAELAGHAYREAGLTWPEPVPLDDLDEYDLAGLSKSLAPAFAKQNPEFASLGATFMQSTVEVERLRSFQRMFAMLLGHWQGLAHDVEGFESWPAFRERVQRVIRRVQERQGRGRRVLMFTSGGFISGAAQWALGISDKTVLEMNWRIRNSSFTEFVFTGDRFTLDNFNSLPHIHDQKLWTYR
jgi:broad specificity phosphatase PhoE